MDESTQTNSMRHVLEVARQLARPHELGEMLTTIIDAGRAVLNADRGTVFLYDAEKSELFVKVGTGIGELRFSIEQGLVGECARTRKTINVPDCYADPRFNQEVDKQTGYRTHCLLTVPLVGLDEELVGVMQLLNAAKGVFEKADDQIAEAFASHAGVAIQRVRLLEERMVRLKLERDLQLARQIQMNVLPEKLPTLDGYDVASFSQPAEETGGDIYDVIPISSGDGQEAVSLLILLADATGHGIGPALSVTQVRAMLRVGVRLAAGVDDLIGHINNQLTEDLASERFVTAFLGLVDSKRHQVVYHSAGQAPLLHLDAEGHCSWLDASTLPMGILSDMPLDPPVPLDMKPGYFFVLLTDGFYEYMNAAGEQLGKQRIGQVVSAHRSESAQEVMDALLAELWRFAEGAPQMDDLTAVIIKRKK